MNGGSYWRDLGVTVLSLVPIAVALVVTHGQGVPW